MGIIAGNCLHFERELQGAGPPCFPCCYQWIHFRKVPVLFLICEVIIYITSLHNLKKYSISKFTLFSLCFFIEIEEESGFTSIPTAFYWVVITMTTVICSFSSEKEHGVVQYFCLLWNSYGFSRCVFISWFFSAEYKSKVFSR